MFFFFFVPPTRKRTKKKKARRLKLSWRCASRCWRACLNSGFYQALKHADKLFPPSAAMLTDSF
jgi:hypothetical protein